MKIWPDTLQTAWWDITTDVDSASATAEVYLAGAWHALTWSGAATHTGSTWTRRGTLLVSGANPLTGVKPTSADGRPLVRVTVGGEVAEEQSSTRIELQT